MNGAMAMLAHAFLTVTREVENGDLARSAPAPSAS